MYLLISLFSETSKSLCAAADVVTPSIPELAMRAYYCRRYEGRERPIEPCNRN